MRGKIDHRPATQQVDCNLQKQGDAKSNPEDGEHVTIRRDKCLIHHPLQQEWRQHDENLQRQRQNQNLGQRAPHAAHRASQLLQADRRCALHGLELGRRCQLHHN
ncbi:hypothetical protein G6F35_018402 [Rhizopus arrhizus]|nr:hypothetical protein G6F35_018402 [Rhizopus arrhizus]